MDSPNWTAYNAAQSEEKTRFAELLADLSSTVPQPPRLPVAGRPRLPLSDMVFASVYKVYCGFSSRRFTSDLSDAYANGLTDSKPHFNSGSRYLSDPQFTDILKELITARSLPLKAIETDFAVDSSGFSTCRYVRWFSKKYARETDNREWVKVHLMCGVNTKVVTAVDVSGWTAYDTNFFIPLLARTAQHFEVTEVSADKAYLSCKNLNAVEAVGGMPFIPFKSNTVDPTEAGAWARLYHLFMYQREAYMEHYHKRSNIETAYSMIKGKFGSALKSKGDAGQINEALCKVLAHNICAYPGDVRPQHPPDFLCRISGCTRIARLEPIWVQSRVGVFPRMSAVHRRIFPVCGRTTPADRFTAVCKTSELPGIGVLARTQLRFTPYFS